MQIVSQAKKLSTKVSLVKDIPLNVYNRNKFINAKAEDYHEFYNFVVKKSFLKYSFLVKPLYFIFIVINAQISGDGSLG